MTVNPWTPTSFYKQRKGSPKRWSHGPEAQSGVMVEAGSESCTMPLTKIPINQTVYREMGMERTHTLPLQVHPSDFPQLFITLSSLGPFPGLTSGIPVAACLPFHLASITRTSNTLLTTSGRFCGRDSGRGVGIHRSQRSRIS